MNGEALKGMFRRRAQIFLGEVVSLRPNGDYRVVLHDTQGEVTATPLTVGANFTIGHAVLVTRPDAAGRGVGNVYSILGLAGSGARNITLAGRVTEGHEATGVTITSIEPIPTSLAIGGAEVVVSIRGTGFTAAPTYGHTGIVNHVAPVVTATLITLQIKANGGTPAGRYSLTLGAIVMPNAIYVS